MKDIKIKRIFENKRTFNYEKDGITLSFTLDINNLKQMQTFMELLEAGEEDILVQIASSK